MKRAGHSVEHEIPPAASALKWKHTTKKKWKKKQKKSSDQSKPSNLKGKNASNPDVFICEFSSFRTRT